MTKTFEDLEEKVDRIEAVVMDAYSQRVGLFGATITDFRHELDTLTADLKSLRILLEGDTEQMEIFRKAKATNTCPNVPEPPPGALEVISGTLATLSESFLKLSERVEERDDAHPFVAKLEAFFGPMLENKNPPLDGNQIATKDYVDTALTRIARVLREEADTVRKGLRTEIIHTSMVDFLKQLTNSSLARMDPKRDNTASTWWTEAVRRLEWMLSREEARFEHENRPSRLASLVYAVTGFEKNGVRS